jgi:hypothetical protein
MEIATNTDMESQKLQRLYSSHGREEISPEGEFEKRFSKTPGPPVIPKILFPCPYVLKDPSRSQKNRSCFGHGWEIHRLKYTLGLAIVENNVLIHV